MADAHVVLPAYAGMIHELEANVNKTVAVLPAYAGMIPGDPLSNSFLDGAPRVCGDDPYKRIIDTVNKVCSPRMRG